MMMKNGFDAYFWSLARPLSISATSELNSFILKGSCNSLTLTLAKQTHTVFDLITAPALITAPP